MSYKTIFCCAIICGIISYFLCCKTYEFKMQWDEANRKIDQKIENLEEQCLEMVTDDLDLYTDSSR